MLIHLFDLGRLGKRISKWKGLFVHTINTLTSCFYGWESFNIMQNVWGKIETIVPTIFLQKYSFTSIQAILTKCLREPFEFSIYNSIT